MMHLIKSTSISRYITKANKQTIDKLLFTHELVVVLLLLLLFRLLLVPSLFMNKKYNTKQNKELVQIYHISLFWLGFVCRVVLSLLCQKYSNKWMVRVCVWSVCLLSMFPYCLNHIVQFISWSIPSSYNKQTYKEIVCPYVQFLFCNVMHFIDLRLHTNLQCIVFNSQMYLFTRLWCARDNRVPQTEAFSRVDI